MVKQLLILTLSALTLSACTHTASQSETQQPAAEQADSYAAVAAAIQSGQTASCVLTKKDGTGEMRYSIKGEKVRVSGLTGQTQTGAQASSMLLDGEFMYTWDETTKEGMKFPIPDPAETQQAQEQVPQIPDLTDETSRQELTDDGYEINCTVEAVPDSVFTPPADVTFTDASAVMEGAQQMLQQINNNPTTDVTAEDQEKLQEQAQKLMQQYGE